MNYTIQEVENAYRKFKNYVYYSTGNLFYRQKIAEFECSDLNNISNEEKLIVEGKLDKLLEWLNKPNLEIRRFQKDIGYHAIPKGANSGILNTEKGSKIPIVHNTQAKSSHVDRLTYLIDAPIEVHIISTLWVIQNGHEYQKNYEKNNYGNILTNNNDLLYHNLRLFKPYFYNYQKWRDNAISIGRREIKDNYNVAIIGLDVKDFFNSCLVTKDDYLLHSKDDRIGVFLFDVSKLYYKKLEQYH